MGEPSTLSGVECVGRCRVIVRPGRLTVGVYCHHRLVRDLQQCWCYVGVIIVGESFDEWSMGLWVEVEVDRVTCEGWGLSSSCVINGRVS